MSDTFWVSLFTFFTLLAKGVLDEWRVRRQNEHNLKVKDELHANTLATIAGSAQAAREAAGAKEAATIAAEKSDSIEKKTDKIEERLNGGDEGLGARVAKNEARLESLEIGQKSHDRAIESVARAVDQLVLNFATFAKDFKENRPPAQIRGENGGRE